MSFPRQCAQLQVDCISLPDCALPRSDRSGHGLAQHSQQTAEKRSVPNARLVKSRSQPRILYHLIPRVELIPSGNDEMPLQDLQILSFNPSLCCACQPLRDRSRACAHSGLLDQWRFQHWCNDSRSTASVQRVSVPMVTKLLLYLCRFGIHRR